MDQREEAAVATIGLTEFRRQDPPKFKGEYDPDKADIWLQEIEKIFDILHCPDKMKVEYVAYLLIGEAEYWWQGARQITEGNHEDMTWEVFKRRFLDKYFPKSARAGKEDQFLRLYQGSLTASEYATKFESLAKHFRYFRNQMDEEYMCERFESELMYEIKECVGPLDIHQYQVLVEKCKKVEIMKRGRLNRGVIGGPARPQKPSHLAKYFQEKDTYDNKEVVNNKDVARRTTRGHVYHISGEEAPSSLELIQGECLIARKILGVIYDYGATHSFISLDWVDSLQLDVTTLPFMLNHQQTEVFFEGRSSKTCVSQPISMTPEVVVDGIPLVKYFSQVFQPDVLGLPSTCDVEFSIDVIPYA
ncbi:uncharacterized protein [Cicer arietinum]|uniref:Uncharacterized protein LOC101507682 n=1 Tax=Cicer arietinum TaxID=3827 RepID=A0A1S2Z2X6_CICAR|nr:uncharacterized protein LOC101507682 [Cicer arietinum]